MSACNTSNTRSCLYHSSFFSKEFAQAALSNVSVYSVPVGRSSGTLGSQGYRVTLATTSSTFKPSLRRSTSIVDCTSFIRGCQHIYLLPSFSRSAVKVIIKLDYSRRTTLARRSAALCLLSRRASVKGMLVHAL